MKKFLSIFLIFVCFLGTSCNVCIAQKTVPQKTMLEIREIQTRYFETPDTFKVAQAIVNTLQDNGFIIQNIEPELGYIRAKKEDKLKRTLKGRVVLYSTCIALDTFSTICGNSMAAMDLYANTVRLQNEIAPHTVIFDSNIVIEQVGKRTKVRFSVIEKVLENADGYTTVKSSPRSVVRHYNPEIYQEFFNQVDKNLFIEKI